MSSDIIRPIEFPYRGDIAALDIDDLAKEMMYEAHRQGVYREAAEAKAGYHEELAMTDHLTGLNSRRGFEGIFGQLAAEIKRLSHDNIPPFSLGSVIMFDLVKFKALNDEHGHDEGDRTLQQVATLASAALREGDVLARLGGDEFAAYLPNTPESGAEVVGEKIRQVIKDGTKTEGSVGVSAIPSSGSLQEALKQADEAQYIAKNQGSSRVVGYQELVAQKV
jgi:diguanylate cyclase (GGDEF)-like protein